MTVTRRSSSRSSTKAKSQASKEKAKEVAAKKAKVTKKKIEKKEEKEAKIVVEEKEAKIVVEEKPASKDDTKASPELTEEKVVTVEACKSWGAFKSRSAKIQKGVGSKAKVLINKDKPGKGNFIVKVSGVDEPIVELKAMKRPFPALKQLDMDEIVEKVLAAIGSE